MAYLDPEQLYTISFRQYLRRNHLPEIPRELLGIFGALERQRQLQHFIRAFIENPHPQLPQLLAQYINYIDRLPDNPLHEPFHLVCDHTRPLARNLARQLNHYPHRVITTAGTTPHNHRGTTFHGALIANADTYGAILSLRLLGSVISVIENHPGTFLIIHANNLRRRPGLRTFSAARPDWWLTLHPANSYLHLPYFHHGVAHPYAPPGWKPRPPLSPPAHPPGSRPPSRFLDTPLRFPHPPHRAGRPSPLSKIPHRVPIP